MVASITSLFQIQDSLVWKYRHIILYLCTYLLYNETFNDCFFAPHACLSTPKYFFNILLVRLACHRLYVARKPPSYIETSHKKKSEFYYYDAPGTCITSTCYCSPLLTVTSKLRAKTFGPKQNVDLYTYKNGYIPAMLPACKTFLLNSIFTTLVKHFSDISTNKVTCCFVNTGCLMRRLGGCGHVPLVCTLKRALNVSAQFVLLVFLLLGHFSHCHTITQRVVLDVGSCRGT